MRVAPLQGHGFGAIVTGFNPAEIDHPDMRRLLRKLWVDKGLVVFRDLQVDADLHVRLSQVFGALEIHPVDTSHAGRHGELIDIRYRPEDGNIYELDGLRIANWQPWHSDLAFTVGRNRGGILRALILPREGGRTGFIDQTESYAALPEALKARIEDLHVIYQLDLDATKARFAPIRPSARLRAASAVTRAMARHWPRVSHPLVCAHPESGCKILNFSPWHAVGIKEMPGADGDRLLMEIAGYAADERRAYDHDWLQDDLILWDNWRMLHCSRGMPEQEARYLQRTTIAGDYGLGRAEPEAA
jgi:taurine dioxygenase